MYVCHVWCQHNVPGESPVQQLGGGVVEAICRGEAPVLGSASIDSCAHFSRQHFTQLHTPLVKAVQTPNEPLHVPCKPFSGSHSILQHLTEHMYYPVSPLSKLCLVAPMQASIAHIQYRHRR